MHTPLEYVVEESDVIILCQGGLGDQLCTEPVVRRLMSLKPSCGIYVVSLCRHFFSHLDVKSFEYGESFETKRPSVILKTFSSEDLGFNCNLFHPVDFISMSILKRSLPPEHRSMRLGSFGGSSMVSSEDVMVHPGMTWPTKTFPSEWWQEVVDGISKRRRVVLVGSKTVMVECPIGCLDMRNCEMTRFMAEMSSGCPLVTNDSFPVHVAGAFDNWICLIPTAKHHGLVLPYRKGSNSYRTSCLFKRLMSEDIVGDFDAFPKGKGMMDYLPDPSEVVEEACSH